MSNYLSSPRSLELLSFTTNAISNGDGYSGGQLFQGVTAGNTKTVYIENTNAEKDVVVLTPNVASDGQIYTRKRRPTPPRTHKAQLRQSKPCQPAAMGWARMYARQGITKPAC